MAGLVERYLGLVREIYEGSRERGGRLPGSPGDRWVEEYLASFLEGLGLEVHVQSYRLRTWLPRAWSLEVRLGEQWVGVESYFMARTGPGSVEGRLRLVGDAHTRELPAGVEGDIVVGLLSFPSLDLSLLEAVALYKSDPYGHIQPRGGKPSVFMTRLEPSECGCPVDPESYEAAWRAGAAGYVGVLENYPDMGCGGFSYYAPSDGLFRGLPGVWVPGWEKRLVDAAREGARARLSVEAEVGEAEGRNVYAVIPGRSEEMVVVHSHHDAPYGGAVQDASGVALVSLLAEHYARRLREGWTPRKTLVFLYTEGHFDAGSGQVAFLEHVGRERILVDIAIEHIAKEYVARDGRIVETGAPEPRGLFISEGEKWLVEAFREAMEKARPHATLLLPTTTPLGVPSDANRFWRSGVPVASLISGPIYMFSECDTPEKVYTGDLENLVAMYTLAIDKLVG